jgi:hypothetical protein
MSRQHHANDTAASGRGSRRRNPSNSQSSACRNKTRFVAVLSVTLMLAVVACSTDRTLTAPPDNVSVLTEF